MPMKALESRMLLSLNTWKMFPKKVLKTRGAFSKTPNNLPDSKKRKLYFMCTILTTETDCIHFYAKLFSLQNFVEHINISKFAPKITTNG